MKICDLLSSRSIWSGTCVALTAALMLSYQNCSKVDFAHDELAAKSDDQAPAHHSDNVEVVRAACNNQVPVEKSVDVFFPKPTHTCKWNEGGNLAPRDRYFQARIEQAVGFDLPAQAKICDMSFQFDAQSMRYDDHFVFSFNGSVLASSYRVDGILPEKSGVHQFQWSHIAGQFWNTSREEVYCLGGEEGLSSCSWPATDTQGTIKMQFKPELIQEIMAFELNRSRHEFQFTTIGDNDEWDCEHSDLRFKVTVKYVQ